MIKMNVEKNLGDIHIKCGFEIASTGITAICGASGAGKTTLINMVAGLLTPDKGVITFNDKEFFNSSKHINIRADKRFTGYVFQESRLFPNMSVKKNLLYGYNRKSDASLVCHIEQVCQLLGISHLLDRYPQKLSGGEKQRVAIGRALLSHPEILLMDEPLASLDVARKQELIDYIKLIHSHYKIPILYVSHSVDEILQLADNAVYMEKGELKYYGDVVEILNKTSLKYVDDSSFNTIFEGEIQEYDSDNSQVIISFDGGIVTCSSLEIEKGKKVRFAVNTDDVVLSTDYPKNISIRNIYKGVIKNIIKQHNNLYDVEVDIGAGIWARISYGAYKDLSITEGKEIYVMFKSAAVSESIKIVH